MAEQRVKRKLSPPLDDSQELVQASKHSKDNQSRPNAQLERQPAEDTANDVAVCADFFADSDDDWCDVGVNTTALYTLDLSQWTRCKVLTVERCANQSLLVVVEEKRNKAKAKCYLFSPWNTLEHVAPGVMVSILAVRDADNGAHFIVNAEHGFFVTNPDLLVSGTTVVGSLYCARRGVLQETFRMVDAENQQMHIGTLAHSIFQQCITDDRCNSLEDVRQRAESWLASSRLVSTLYTYKMNTAEALAILDPYLIEIAAFLKKHVSGRQGTALAATNGGKPNREALTIHTINDIEENIWCHQLGIKGKIDATVSVSCGADRPTVMPLELKTGRASYSFEHVGQLVLYEMMMNLVGHSANSGLLVYLREGKCSRMVGNRNTRRDLIMLRNEIAHYFDRWMFRNGCGDSEATDALPMLPLLPDPINNERACVKCPYNTVCVVTAQKEPNRRPVAASHGLSLIAEEAAGHLTNADIDYFIRWTGIVYLEQKESVNDYSVRKLWTMAAEERVRRGWCIAGLGLTGRARLVDERYFHTFCIGPPSSSSETGSRRAHDGSALEANQPFEAGDYVICSTTKRIAVAAGHIVSFVGRELVAAFERDLGVNYGGETFLLDRTEQYKSSGFNLANLAMLLGKTEEAERWRRIIVEREKPSFADGIMLKSMIPNAKQMLESLNRHQKLATLKAASTSSYCLLKGLPGTGKTQTIVGLIRILAALGESVLLTSNTHSAVDNVLKRLAQHAALRFIRLGTLDRIDPAIRPFSASVLAERCETPEQLAELYNQFNIVAVTCQGSSHPLIAQRTFDFCIVDEATQVFQSSIIRPLLRSKRFLLVGDPEQLPPVVRSSEARSLGATESLFHRLDQEGAFCILPTQYRMNRVLTKLANDFTYDGKLVCGNDGVANATLRLPQLGTLRQLYEVERWMMRALSNQMDLSAVMLDTGSTHALNQHHQLPNVVAVPELEEKARAHRMNCANVAEAALTVYICGALLRAGVPSTAIGVMAPFRAQVELIRQHLRQLLLAQQHTRQPLSGAAAATQSFGTPELEERSADCSIEVNTVDQFQGKDKKLIIYSCTRTAEGAAAPDRGEPIETAKPPGPEGGNSNEILYDKRRLTVAITRAKEKLIVIGDRATLDTYTPFRKLFKVASSVAGMKVVDKKDGFEWSNIMESLNLLAD